MMSLFAVAAASASLIARHGSKPDGAASAGPGPGSMASPSWSDAWDTQATAVGLRWSWQACAAPAALADPFVPGLSSSSLASWLPVSGRDSITASLTLLGVLALLHMNERSLHRRAAIRAAALLCVTGALACAACMAACPGLHAPLRHLRIAILLPVLGQTMMAASTGRAAAAPCARPGVKSVSFHGTPSRERVLCVLHGALCVLCTVAALALPARALMLTMAALDYAARALFAVQMGTASWTEQLRRPTVLLAAVVSTAMLLLTDAISTVAMTTLETTTLVGVLPLASILSEQGPPDDDDESAHIVPPLRRSSIQADKRRLSMGREPYCDPSFAACRQSSEVRCSLDSAHPSLCGSSSRTSNESAARAPPHNPTLLTSSCSYSLQPNSPQQQVPPLVTPRTSAQPADVHAPPPAARAFPPPFATTLDHTHPGALPDTCAPRPLPPPHAPSAASCSSVGTCSQVAASRHASFESTASSMRASVPPLPARAHAAHAPPAAATGAREKLSRAGPCGSPTGCANTMVSLPRVVVPASAAAMSRAARAPSPTTLHTRSASTVLLSSARTSPTPMRGARERADSTAQVPRAAQCADTPRGGAGGGERGGGSPSQMVNAARDAWLALRDAPMASTPPFRRAGTLIPASGGTQEPVGVRVGLTNARTLLARTSSEGNLPRAARSTVANASALRAAARGVRMEERALGQAAGEERGERARAEREGARARQGVDDDTAVVAGGLMHGAARVSSSDAACSGARGSARDTKQEEVERPRRSLQIRRSMKLGPKLKPFHASITGKVHVLSVDDSPINQMVIEAAIGRAGWSVEKVMDGPSALACLEHNPVLPDIILLDVMMPGLSGLDVARAVHERFPHTFVPIIMISALTDAAAVCRGLDAGACDYLPKPFHHGELLARCTRLLAMRESCQVEERRRLGDALLLDEGGLESDMDQRLMQDGSRDMQDPKARLAALLAPHMRVHTQRKEHA